MEPMQAESPPSDGVPEGVLDSALRLVEFLRAGCSWDAAQTPRTLQPYLLEEAHEVVDAIASGDENALRDELGDLLLNVAFQVVLAEERNAFDRNDVAAALYAKMRRRHPQLYGDGPAESWEAVKARERASQPSGPLLADLPSGLDPLLRAHRIQQRVATVGFDWADPQGALEKVREETSEVAAELSGRDPDHLEEELGDLLFAVVNLTRLAAVHPTAALARANAKFARRFSALEALAAERSIVLGEAALDELDRLWDEVKRDEKERA